MQLSDLTQNLSFLDQEMRPSRALAGLAIVFAAMIVTAAPAGAALIDTPSVADTADRDAGLPDAEAAQAAAAASPPDSPTVIDGILPLDYDGNAHHSHATDLNRYLNLTLANPSGTADRRRRDLYHTLIRDQNGTPILSAATDGSAEGDRGAAVSFPSNPVSQRSLLSFAVSGTGLLAGHILASGTDALTAVTASRIPALGGLVAPGRPRAADSAPPPNERPGGAYLGDMNPYGQDRQIYAADNANVRTASLTLAAPPALKNFALFRIIAWTVAQWRQVVPKPASFALLGAGLVGVALTRRPARD